MARQSNRAKKPLPVMPEMCSSCPFREDGKAIELEPGRLEQIKEYLLKGTTHICHHAVLHNTGAEEHACRGARDYQLMIWSRMGIITEPTDEALAETMKAHGIEAPKAPIPGRKSKAH